MGRVENAKWKQKCIHKCTAIINALESLTDIIYVYSHTLGKSAVQRGTINKVLQRLVYHVPHAKDEAT